MRNIPNNPRKPNPAIMKGQVAAMIKDQLAEAKKSGTEFAVMTMKLFAYLTLHDKFGFDENQLERFRVELDELGDSLYEKYFTIEDILTVCLDELHMNLSLEDIQKIDPLFNMMMRAPEEDTKKENV